MTRGRPAGERDNDYHWTIEGEPDRLQRPCALDRRNPAMLAAVHDLADGEVIERRLDELRVRVRP